MNWKRIFPATFAMFAVALGSLATAVAIQPIEKQEDVDEICRFSEPDKQVVVGEGSDQDGASSSQEYQATRRKMAQEVMEVTISAEQLALIGYDQVTGVLSVSGFRDYPLFSGQQFLRFREGCALHFELSEEQARDWTARVRMGGAGLTIGFLLNAHDNYEQPFCQEEKAAVAGDDAASSVENVSRQILMSDLLYAKLIAADGKTLSTYYTELGHRLHLRTASQTAAGQPVRLVPRVEVTSLVWTGGSSSGVVAAEKSDVAEDSAGQLDSWWRRAIEAAAYPCYQRGLARNGRLQGAFVMRMSASELGHAAAVLLDTLQFDDVSSCILERVRAIRTPSTDTRQWESLKVTLLFSLQRS